MRKAKSIPQRLHDMMFGLIHGNRLIYNTCWEDPRLDRRMLKLTEGSKLVVITSAGDNALDYLLDSPASIDCVDMNPRQNALLELKRALFSQADFLELDAFFGQGGSSSCQEIYRSLSPKLPDYARRYWDANLDYFSPNGLRSSFYYRGASGSVAFIFSRLLGLLRPGLKGRVARLMDADSLAKQRKLYDEIEPLFWGFFSRWLIGRSSTMAMLGVPRPQINLIKQKHPGGLGGFVREKMRRVFTELPISENYFWRVYFTGRYGQDCRPEYLKRANFASIAARLDRLKTHTSTLSGFLRANPGQYTHFILLDHQDWLAWHDPAALNEEWELILANAAPGAKILMRSAGLDVSFVPEPARRRLQFHPEITEPLHALDRVGTYGSQHLAVVA